MSYDLYFCAAHLPSREEFAGHFAERAAFKVDGTQAWYENEDTGVYFSFDMLDTEDREELGDDSDAWASFNLNYYRPSFFALEAAIELDAFVERFGAKVSDPQIEGIFDTYAREPFLHAWDHGNRCGYEAVQSSAGASPPHARPAEELTAIWRWNYGRNALQERIGDGVFVPRICFVTHGGQLVSTTVWGNAVPIVLPKTDSVIVGRDEFAPRGWFRKKGRTALAHWKDVEPLMSSRRSETEPLVHYFCDFDAPPADLVKWIRSLPDAGSMEAVSADQILDAELAQTGADSR